MSAQKTFLQTLHHGNYIVRDHQVHGVRTLPGVALLDMIYRLSPALTGTLMIELRHILFKQPVVTSETFDQQILVTFVPRPSHWQVTVTSKKVKNGQVIDPEPAQNMECLLYVREEKAAVRQTVDLQSFIRSADEQWDMDEMYEMARRTEIQHFTFMKTAGRVYQKKNQEVMRLQLSELAYSHFDSFYAHVAFLDGASMAGLSFSKNGTQNWINEDRSAYMPITIERFCIHRKLTPTIYTHTEERAPSGALPVNPDLVSRDITIYDEKGEVLVEFGKFSVKRIREPQAIRKLIGLRSPEPAPLADRVQPSPGAGEQTPAGTSTSAEGSGPYAVVSYLKEVISGVLHVHPDAIGPGDGFYELGLDSVQLLGLVKVLEEKVSGTLYPTLLFEYSTIDSLSAYLLEHHAGAFDAGVPSYAGRDREEGVRPAGLLPSADSGEIRARIRAYLQGVIAEVLHVQPNAIGPGDGFYELGLDSVQLLGLVKVLEETISGTLYPTLLFEYSTIDSLSAYLLEHHAGAFDAGAPPFAGRGREGGVRPAVLLPSADSGEIRARIRAYLQGVIAEVLHVQPNAIGPGDGFYELGLDSVHLLGLVKVLEEKVSGALYPTLLFEYSTIDSLSGYLLEHHARAFGAGAFRNGGEAGGERGTGAGTAPDPAGETLFFERVWRKRAMPSLKREDPRYHAVVLYDDTPLGVGSGTPYFDEIIRLNSDKTDGAGQFEDKLKQLLLYIKSFVKQKAKSELLLQVISAGESPYVFALEGLLKTAYMENPKINSQIIWMEPEGDRGENRTMVEVLREEARSHGRGTVSVRYKGSPAERFVQEHGEVHLQEHRPAYRQNGVYVITGGLGGLGLHVADHLASRQRVKLALIGRSKPDEAKARTIRQLVAKGAEVVYLQADISRETDVEQAFGEIRNRWGGITGIFHCAGALKDQILMNKDADEVSEVLGPKVYGMRHIDMATRGERLDCFVLFSSVSAVTGNIGQADYASANAYMDMLALERQKQVDRGERFGRTVTVNWPLWLEGGMRVEENLQELFYRSKGNRALPTREGLQAMDTVLAHSLTQAIILYGDGEGIRADFLGAAAAGEEDGTRPESTGRPVCSPESDDDIAIIGLSGRYPMAGTMDEFFGNLRDGKDCIAPIPTERWADNSLSFDVEQYYRYGGFLDRIDEFDPMFFNISAAQAEMMDPQARHFLQTAWEACEDAGFPLNRSEHRYPSNSDKSVGVFAGVFWNSYELFSAEMTQRGTPSAFGVSSASIANMVSYCLNFHGPSMAVDSMCSSSLTAIHLACESIKRGECHYAVAGGVNLVTHPHKYVFLQQAQFLSSDGRCRSFGKDGDGYVPGEGVGALLLAKRSQAEKEGYPIYGVIKGSAINHVGKTSGATVPDPVAQSEVISDAITRSGIDPRTISYVEAHGTGTSLGDPIELHGLERAFAKWSSDKQYCAVGSVKSNIGHAEAASGVAGLTKILLQMKHKILFPSLHAEQLNPYISFENTSFYVQRESGEWRRPELEVNGKKTVYPRRAGISSFGANGSNAHLIVEEYTGGRPQGKTGDHRLDTPCLVPLSAKHEDALQRYAGKLLQYLVEGHTGGAAEVEPSPPFAEAGGELKAIAYTLQTGREAMNCRVAFVVRSREELLQKLEGYCSGERAISGCFQGGVHQEPRSPGDALSADQAVADSIASRNLEALAGLWVSGISIDWNGLYDRTDTMSRVRLPTYPFAKERYWVPKAETNRPAGATVREALSRSSNHPLLQRLDARKSEEQSVSLGQGKSGSGTENLWNFALSRGGVQPS
ncbi:SDR family NAD(P)-dependent oxidoreductase [Paenibacillus sp. S-38]|uniref:type I polyketide synthase n=1 Tax=Paenibacillus sp. S-38 TaxID=3416710 RepID=UPI003CF7AA0F